MAALPTTAAEVLDLAADIIEPEGMWSTDHSWSDGTTGDDRTGFCIFDAVVKAHPQGKIINGWSTAYRSVFASPTSTMATQGAYQVYGRSLDASWSTMQAPNCGAMGLALIEAIGPGCEGYPTGLVKWNDATGRTQAEVVGVLRRAAEIARERAK